MINSLPTTREDALRLGQKFYFNGKPCRWAKHIAPRYASINRCVVCQANASKRWGRKPEVRARARDKYAADPEKFMILSRELYGKDLKRSREYARQKYYNNREKRLAARREREREFAEANPIEAKERRRIARARAAEHRREYNKKYRETHSHVYSAAGMARYAKKKLAMPNWITLDEFRDIYAEAKRLTRDTGIRYEVDHIVPLQGKTVSGLHVPWNLQILTQSENVRKSNWFVDGVSL